MPRTRASVAGSSGRPSPQPASSESSYSATGSSSMRTRSVVSGSVSQAEGPQGSRVRVRSELPYFLVGTSFKRVGEHEHAQARVPVVRGHAVGERLELFGDDDDRRLLERFDGHGVVDTPRRTRSSVAQAHHAAFQEARPLVDVGARLLALRAGSIT